VRYPTMRGSSSFITAAPCGGARAQDPAAVFEDLFESNGWKDSWRNGIYDYLHYYSRTHEVLGIACRHARVRFGGDGGKIVELRAEDVVILPAGTGHQRVSASRDLPNTMNAKVQARSMSAR
jgi:uncharacterized protein YjlB